MYKLSKFKMIHTDRAYRKNETSPAGESQFEGKLRALENFGGGTSVTAEIRQELAEMAPPPVEQSPPPADTPPATPVEQINSNLDTGEETIPPVTPPAETTPPVTENTTEPPVIDNTTQGKEGDTPPEQPLSIKSDIFEGGSLDVGGKTTPPKEYSEEINKFATELGYGSPAELMTGLEGFKTASPEFETTKKQLTELQQTIQGLPAELYNSITSFYKGEEDWRSKVTSQGLDFTKGIDSFNDKSLIDSYYPGKFSSEDWDEYKAEDGDVNVKRAMDMALDTAKNSFVVKQTEINGYQASVLENQTKSQELVNNSISQTMSNLSAQMKGLDPAYTNSIQSKIQNREILALFYNQDGTLKSDAAHRFILAQDGANLIEQYANYHKVQASNQATQEILERTSDTPDKTQGGSSTVTADNRSEVQKHIDTLTGNLGKTQKVF